MGVLTKTAKALGIIGGLVASYYLGLGLNWLAEYTVRLIYGPGYWGYLYIQYHVMGFAFFYTIYIMLILIYVYRLPAIKRKPYRVLGDEELPYISIVIPAYNEADRIGRLLQHLSRIDYPRDKMELIVVDDGSSDTTAEVAEKHGARVLRHAVNMGRGAAVKTGVMNAGGELIVTVDADTFPEKDAVRKLVSYMVLNRDKGAACGRLRPAESGGLLGVGQRVEYTLGYAYTKSLKSTIGWMLIPSGAFSIYRRRLLLDADLGETIAEDFDAGLHVIEKKHRLGYVWDAVAKTAIPLTLSSYIRQRIRWSVGGLQVLAKHRRLMFNPRYRDIGLLALPFHLLVGFATMLMELYGISFLILLFLAGVIPLRSLLVLGTWLILLKIYTMILLAPACTYSRLYLKEDIRVAHLVVYWIIYYYLLLYTTVAGILVYSRHGKTIW